MLVANTSTVFKVPIFSFVSISKNFTIPNSPLVTIVLPS